MTTIQGAGPSNGAVGAPTTREAHEPIVVATGIEGAIEEAVAQMERQRDALRDSIRDVRQSRRKTQERQLDKQKQAAAFRLASGVIEGGVKAASGAAQTSAELKPSNAALNTKETLGFAEDALPAVTGGLDFAATHRDIDAKRLGNEAEKYGDISDDLDEMESRVERFQDKALNHQDQIGEARVRAQLAASRG